MFEYILKAVPLHATKALWWRGLIAPTHAQLQRYMRRSCHRHAPAAL
jgi:hypothetical protein